MFALTLFIVNIFSTWASKTELSAFSSKRLSILKVFKALSYFSCVIKSFCTKFKSSSSSNSSLEIIIGLIVFEKLFSTFGVCEKYTASEGNSLGSWCIKSDLIFISSESDSSSKFVSILS